MLPFKIFNLLILEKKAGGEREKKREIDLLFHLFTHSLVASCMCPERK